MPGTSGPWPSNVNGNPSALRASGAVLQLVVDMGVVGVPGEAEPRDRLPRLQLVSRFDSDAAVLEVADHAELAVSVVDNDVVAEDHRRRIRRELGELDSGRPERVVRDVSARRRDRPRSGSAYDRSEAVAFERVVVGVAPAVRPHAQLRGERMAGVDAAMGREEVVARGDEHAAGERQVQLRPLPVLVGRELRRQACVAELAGDA